MKIKESIHQKVAVLSLHGKLMGPPATEQLYNRINELLENGVFRIILNLKQVKWINSLGVGAIVKCYSLVKKHNGHFILVGVEDKVRSIFVISQLTKVFTIYQDLDEAIEKLNSI